MIPSIVTDDVDRCAGIQSLSRVDVKPKLLQRQSRTAHNQDDDR